MSNWEARPLSAAQLTYAALDAEILLRAYDECVRRGMDLPKADLLA